MKFSFVAIAFQTILIILFATLVEYNPKQSGASNHSMSNAYASNEIALYPSK